MFGTGQSTLALAQSACLRRGAPPRPGRVCRFFRANAGCPARTVILLDSLLPGSVQVSLPWTRVQTAESSRAGTTSTRHRRPPLGTRVGVTQGPRTCPHSPIADGYGTSVAFRLTPHERGFYPLFTRAAENIVATADQLAKLIGADATDRAELARVIKDCEHVGDELTHEILVKINTTFVTPFDREDIYRLAGALDDVLDAMEEAADRIVLYRLGTLPEGVAAQVEVLRRAAARTARAMPQLERMTELEQYWIDINSLEEEADDLYRTLLGNLLAPREPAPPADVLGVLKIKEVVEILEEAADAFETVANTVESIVVKEA